MSDQEIVRQHRTIWAARPELRAVYQEWFAQLLHCVEGLHPIVEIGAGPGFFKEYFPSSSRLMSFQVRTLTSSVTAGSLPFRSGSVGALVMVDALQPLTQALGIRG